MGEFFVVTSDLKPDLLWVTSSCDSCDRLCTDAEKHFFGSPVAFSVSLRMMAGNSHEAFGKLFDAEYTIPCKSPLRFLRRERKENTSR